MEKRPTNMKIKSVGRFFVRWQQKTFRIFFQLSANNGKTILGKTIESVIKWI
jgi:hypothetical protein